MTLFIVQFCLQLTATMQSEEQLQQQIDAIETELNDKQSDVELLLESERQLQCQVQDIKIELKVQYFHYPDFDPMQISSQYGYLSV